MMSASAFRETIPTIPIQCPPGVIFFVANIVCPWTCITYGLQSQNEAIARCSSVSWRLVSSTSATIFMYGLLFAVSKAGGSTGRNWLPESITKGRSTLQLASIASMYAGGVGTHRPAVELTVYLG